MQIVLIIRVVHFLCCSCVATVCCSAGQNLRRCLAVISSQQLDLI